MNTLEPRTIYDPDLALARAGGRADVRDRMLIGLLDLLDDPERGGRLLDVERYSLEAAICSEAAHAAISVARQVATPHLEAQLRALKVALDAGDLAEAERIGRRLPGAIDAVCAAFSGGGTSGPRAD